MPQRRNDEHYPERQTRQPFPLIWIFAAAAVLLLAGFGLWWASGSSEGGASSTGPRLAVDQERIDFGRVPLDKPVRAEFRITNVGGRTLTLDASAPIQVLEGC
jgi:hypothetical protein